MTRYPYDDDDDATQRPRAQRPLADAPEPELPATYEPPPPPPPSWYVRLAKHRFRMETVLLASSAALLAAVAWPIAKSGFSPEAAPPTTPAAVAPTDAPEPADPPPAVDPEVTPTIQIALLLDTSSSMDGLIDQARSQLWKVVNALDSATFHGATPRLEIALYEYGNDGLSGETGFIRQVSPFTSELDRVSEKLFALKTNGGSEHAGQVIGRSIDELKWADGAGTLKVVYIAGNESFAQGPVSWEDSIERAKAQGIVVNTVLCDGVDDFWSSAASKAGGKFMQIDHNAVAVHIATPQDDQIAVIGRRINSTYIGYGARGRWGLENQVAQDGNAAEYGEGASVTRALSKGSKFYDNGSWDLVDGLAGGSVTLGTVDRGTLPAELRDLSEDELAKVIEDKKAEREKLQKELSKLAKEREEFLAKAGEDGQARLDTAIVGSILEQAQAAGFTIETEA